MKRVSISEARAQLPALVRYLLQSPRRTVFIEHRDLNERLVLITESRLRHLESIAGGDAKASGSSFKLEGSMSSGLSDEELERALDDLESAAEGGAAAKVQRF